MQPFPSTGQGKPTFENISECWLGCSKARGRQNFPSTGQDKYLEMFPKVGSMARGRQNFLSTSQNKYSEMFPSGGSKGTEVTKLPEYWQGQVWQEEQQGVTEHHGQDQPRGCPWMR